MAEARGDADKRRSKREVNWVVFATPGITSQWSSVERQARVRQKQPGLLPACFFAYLHRPVLRSFTSLTYLARVSMLFSTLMHALFETSPPPIYNLRVLTASCPPVSDSQNKWVNEQRRLEKEAEQSERGEQQQHPRTTPAGDVEVDDGSSGGGGTAGGNNPIGFAAPAATVVSA